MKRRLSILLIVVMMLSLAACGRTAAKPEAQEGLTIYASFYPMQFLASQIAGDKATVTSLVPAGVEPHEWDPKPRTMAELQESDMLVYNGAGMEAWLVDLLPSLEKAGVKTVNTSQGLNLIPYDAEKADVHEEEEGEEHEGEELAYDPHVWVSPVKYKQQAQSVLNALVEVDPANQEYYKANHAKLVQQLDKLDSDYRQAAATFKNKKFIVSHSAFEYLAQEYGLTQLPIRGVSPLAEPGSAKLGELIKICKENNIKYIFFESLVSPRLSQTIADAIGAETLVLNDGQGITEKEIKEGRNYITIMYENLENLKKALME